MLNCELEKGLTDIKIGVTNILLAESNVFTSSEPSVSLLEALHYIYTNGENIWGYKEYTKKEFFKWVKKFFDTHKSFMNQRMALSCIYIGLVFMDDSPRY